MKTCTLCNSEKQLNEFSPSKGGRFGLHSRCKQCNCALSAAIRDKKRKDPVAYKAMVRRANLKKDYGLSVEDYDSMLEDAGGVCQICGEPPRGRPLFVDHCHVLGLVRGLLCGHCNTALGLVRESPEILRRMIAYLIGEEGDAPTTPAA